MCLESCAKFDAMSYKHSYFHFADLINLSLIEVNLSLFLFFFYPKIPCLACIGTHFSYVVLENVDKAQTKIRLRKDNVAGKVFNHNYVFQQHDLKAHSSLLMKPYLNLSANLLWFMFFSCFTPLNP